MVMVKIRSSEITPERVYLSRRKFMKGLGAIALGSAALAACGAPASTSTQSTQGSSATPLAATTGAAAPSQLPTPYPSGPAEKLTAWDDITNYNNYYEFSEEKEPVADLAKNFKTRPWTVQVGGFVNNPKTYAFDDLIKKFPAQERVYRHRCVEGWSMVMPWTGFPLNGILKEADPTSQGKFVRFTSIMAPDQMPGQNDQTFQWPYTEGLRLDEAMHDLTFVVTGLYGKPLPNQDGAPLRIAVPWKYGFKSAKAIVKIDLVADAPTTLWMAAAPDEYGFYSNVNPNRPHPRWSQATERRIGEDGRRSTIIFNGYGDEVAHLYDGMDLIQNY
jgi:sulfoxide reductase catalytic subunit YedY